MLSRDDVVAWVAVRHGAGHAEKRTSDGGFAFWVDTQPDGVHEGDPHLGGTPVVDLPDPAARKIDHHAFLIRWLSSVGVPEGTYDIDDRVFAFAVVPKTAGNGLVLVVKRTAGVWYLGTSPEVHQAACGARGEAEFYAALLAVVPDADPRRPHDRVPQRYENPF